MIITITAIAGTSMYIDNIINRQGLVTGILYAGSESSAIIDGHILRNNDTFNGVTIFKVNQFSVDFEKDGVRWSQRVQEKPRREWRRYDSTKKTLPDDAIAVSP